MFFTSRSAALVLAILIATATTGLMSIVRGVPPQALVLVAAISFSSSFLLVYASLEYLVFQEIQKVYKLLERLNKRELRSVRKQVTRASLVGGANPIQKLNTEILDMANRKQSEIDELRRLETYRREFLADISHELKTPLFSAQGFIHTLIDGAADDEKTRTRFLLKAANSLDGLGEMVQELLLLSQLETGVLRMKLEVFDLGRLAAEVAEQLEEKATDRSQSIALERPAKPMWVEADRSRLRQVLVNLVENAIKYGKPGGQALLQIAPEKDQVLVRVQDDGTGISTEHLSRIFDRFYRVEKSRSKVMGGIGLGLAIVKQILAAHYINIDVQSQLGVGTAFTFYLKKQKPSLVKGTAAEDAPSAASKGPRESTVF